jgi:hypothetical protein
MSLYGLHRPHAQVHNASHSRSPTWQNWQMLNNPRFLRPVQFNSIITGITALMITTHHRFTVPGFKAEPDWYQKPWEILWLKTQDFDLSRKLMGLMAKHAFIIHPDDWASSTTDYPGHEYPNSYYVRCVPPHNVLGDGFQLLGTEKEQP